MSKILAQCCAKIVVDNVRRRVILKRKSFLPGKLGGESTSEATSITTVFTLFPQRPLLFMKGLLEEMVHIAMSLSYKIPVNSVVHY